MAVGHQVDIEKKGPTEFLGTYESFSALVTRSAEQDIETFLASEHKFEDYCKVCALELCVCVCVCVCVHALVFVCVCVYVCVCVCVCVCMCVV